MTSNTRTIKEILFDQWDPIGVGPYKNAESVGISDEYDDVLNRILSSTDQREPNLEKMLEEFERSIGVQVDPDRRSLAAQRIAALFV